MASDALERWKVLLEDFERSGQTQRDFARSQGVTLGALRYWRQRISSGRAGTSQSAEEDELLFTRVLFDELDTRLNDFETNLKDLADRVNDMEDSAQAIEADDAIRLAFPSGADLAGRVREETTYEERKEQELVASLLSRPELEGFLTIEEHDDRLRALEAVVQAFEANEDLDSLLANVKLLEVRVSDIESEVWYLSHRRESFEVYGDEVNEFKSLTYEESDERDLVDALLADPDFREPLVLSDFHERIAAIEGNVDAIDGQVSSTLGKLETLEQVIDTRDRPVVFRRIEERIRAAQETGADLVGKRFEPASTALQLCRRLRSRGFYLGQDVAGQILNHLQVRRILVLQGPPGSGKSNLASLLPSLLLGVDDSDPYTKIGLSPNTTAFELIGGVRMHNGVFGPHLGALLNAVLTAIESSGQHWLLIDEINRGDISAMLSSLLDNLNLSSKEIVHDNVFMDRPQSQARIPMPGIFRIVGTMNTVDDDQLFKISDPLKRRIGFVKLSFLPRAEEMTLADEDVFRPALEAVGIRADLDRFKEIYGLVDTSKVLFDAVGMIRALVDREPRRAFRHCEIGTGVLLDLLRHLCLALVRHPKGANPAKAVDHAMAKILLPQLIDGDDRVLQALLEGIVSEDTFPRCRKIILNKIADNRIF